MTATEKKKIQYELLQVQAAKMGLELRVDESLEQIDRLKEHIEISTKKELELQEKLKGV